MAATDNDLGLALQASLRQQLGAWVDRPSTAALVRHLAASQALLDEVLRREGLANAADEAMLRQSPAGPDQALQARAQVVVAEARHAMWRWLAQRGRAGPTTAARLATRLQDAAVDLLEVAGRADASDPRQTDWLRLVAAPHTAELDQDHHACAIIGAACWRMSGHGRLRAWQLLVWRLWGMSRHELADALQPRRPWWRWGRRPHALRDVSPTLQKARVLGFNKAGDAYLRPRSHAAAACLVILQAHRIDAEHAAKQAVLLPNVRHIGGEEA